MTPHLRLVIGNKNYSSWSLRPWLALTEAGIEFEEIRIRLSQPTSPQEILQYSPSGRVPVLLDGTMTIWDSLAIVEYVAERFPQLHWWPAEPEARAIARSVSCEMHAGFQTLRQQMPMNCRERHPRQDLRPDLTADIQRILQIWQTCRQTFGQGDRFLFGAFCIADAMFAPVVSRFITYGVALDATSQAYVDAIWHLPAMQQWVAEATAEPEVIEDP